MVMSSRKGYVPENKGMKYFKKEGEKSVVSEVSDNAENNERLKTDYGI